MNLRKKLVSTTLVVATFVMVPSPMTQGQNNSDNLVNHVDGAVFGDSAGGMSASTAAVVDVLAMREIEMIAAVATR